jgi:hypothetical protein
VQVLERRIDELESERAARASGFGGAYAARLAGGATSPASATANAPAAASEYAGPAVAMSGAAVTPEMRRYLHVQARTNARRMYADFVSEQGLSDDEARALYDLLAAHEIAQVNLLDSPQPGEDAKNQERDLASAAQSLLGASRAGELENYRNSLPLRFEVAAVAEQLEGSNTPLTEEQRRNILRSISDRSQFEELTFASGQSLEQTQRTYNEWQESQAARFAALVRSTLNSEQRKHYDDFESARREMRGGN